ncbi:hypothetical protein EDD85DRAFT_863433 [Armillaria nabsnona]|nr:hypothetical protein EDD85DRAFT_863433 [Armillaria nabsnona]
MSLLVLPAELLEKIVACDPPSYGNSWHPVIRLTCRTLCDVATPFVFKHLCINLKTMEKNKSHAIAFLKELSQGQRLGRFVQVLRLHSISYDYSSKPNFLEGLRYTISLSRNKDIGKLMLAAVSQMQGLQEFHWMMRGRVVIRSRIIDQIVHSLSNHPHLHFVSISLLHIEQDVSWAHFRGLTHLIIDGNGSLDYAPTIIANSPNLFRLEVIQIHCYACPSPPRFPVISLFGAFSEGTHSSIRTLSLSGTHLNLEPSTVPALIPHFRNLTNFRIPDDIKIPNVFWIAMLDAKVFLRYVSSGRHSALSDSFLGYLVGYRGLKEVHLQLGDINTRDILDKYRANVFLRHIIPMHSQSLTSVAIEVEYAGCWCFDVPMLEALLLCTNLAYIGISVDGQRSRVRLIDNIITKLLENLHRWHHLETLDIKEIPTFTTTNFSPPGFPARVLPRDEITHCLTAFKCIDPTPQMFRLQIYTSFALDLQLRQQDPKSRVYTFMKLPFYTVRHARRG